MGLDTNRVSVKDRYIECNYQLTYMIILSIGKRYQYIKAVALITEEDNNKRERY